LQLWLYGQPAVAHVYATFHYCHYTQPEERPASQVEDLGEAT